MQEARGELGAGVGDLMQEASWATKLTSWGRSWVRRVGEEAGRGELEKELGKKRGGDWGWDGGDRGWGSAIQNLNYGAGDQRFALNTSGWHPM